MRHKREWTQEQIKLITDVVAKGATPDELKLFLYRCEKMELDPLKPGQIYFIKYGSRPGSIVIGIEGFRSKAARTGKLSGIKRGVLRDANGVCTGAFAEVCRSDWDHPAYEEVLLSEYNTKQSTWNTMPETMIKKVAEAAALRMAFPDDLGGIYIQEEKDQESILPPPVYPDEPGEKDGVPVEVGLNLYHTPGGTYARRTIAEIVRNVETKELSRYIDAQEVKFEKGKQVKPPWWDDWTVRIEGALADLENSTPTEPGDFDHDG